VREATELVHEGAPELKVEGPIQYDAAVDAHVARPAADDAVRHQSVASEGDTA
jgi:phosphate acetyltransferase